MTELDYFTKADIEISVRRIDELLGCGILFSPKLLSKSAFIEILILLRDLMYKSQKYASRISFDDDVKKTDEIKDITDLIKYVRDALCHADSDNNYIEPGKGKATFIVLSGKITMKVKSFVLNSKYDDDICFFFGSQGIYLKRHIIKAFEEAKTKLLPLVRESRSS